MPYEIYNKNQYIYIENYWKNEIIKYFRENVTSYLNKLINKGDVIWIVSASPLIYILPILKYIKIDKIIAVEPNKIINYGIGKVERVEEFSGKNLNNIHGYVGDSWNGDGQMMMKLKNLHPKTVVKFVDDGDNLDHNIRLFLKKFNIQII